MKASPLGVMAFREYKVVLEEVANQRHQILEERRKRRSESCVSACVLILCACLIVCKHSKQGKGIQGSLLMKAGQP